jgi:coenzyme PQQ synthesis protein D (PqqD)
VPSPAAFGDWRVQIDDSLSPLFRSAASEHVVTTGLADGIALLDLRTNEYFSLDGVGSFLWRMLQTPKSKEELVDAVCEQYEIGHEVCLADVEHLLEDLADAALVEVVAGAAA